MNLKAKHIVITGAAGGIGSALTRLFAKNGAHVFALDLQAKPLQALTQKMEDEGYKINTHVFDVTKSTDHKNLIAHFKKNKITPHVWINNAGISYPEAFSKISEEKFAGIMNVNFNGVVNGTRTALHFMEPRGLGTIINIASTAGHIPSPFLSAYAASKHAVVGFTRSLQIEYTQKCSPVRFMLVSPAFADTDIMKTNPAFCFPKKLKWTVQTPTSVAKAILDGLKIDAEEIHPGFGNKAMRMMYEWLPATIFRSTSRILTARSWRELIGIDAIHEE